MKPEHDEALVIEQRDRDAAADSLGIGIPGSPLEIRKTNIRLGNCDDGWLVKAFARHRTTDAARIAGLEGLLAEFVEVNDEPCHLDHHGYCQTHFLEEDCVVKRARATLRRNPDAG